MLDIKFIRNNVSLIEEAVQKKSLSFDVQNLLRIDDERRVKIQTYEELKSRQNSANEYISQAQGDEKRNAIENMKAIAAEAKIAEEELKAIQQQFDEYMLMVPNIVHPSVPFGKNDTENVVAEVIGDIPKFSFVARDHMELLQMHDMVDCERAVKLAGSRAYFLKNDGALLEQAVLQYALKKIQSKDFQIASVPYMVNSPTMRGTGYLTDANQDDAFHLTKDDKWLIATAEIPLTAYHADEILDISDLPKKYAALSPCFRREAGSYGKDTAGLYRVHQFQKVEQVVILPEDKEASDFWLQQIILNAREVLDDLKIPYRVLQLCTGDLALGKYNSFDIECYMPSRKGYGETHSASAFLDFQARRIKMRYRTEDGDIRYCYTLNNTVIASPRILIALVENYQQADGSILIPEVLRPYMNKDSITSSL